MNEPRTYHYTWLSDTAGAWTCRECSSLVADKNVHDLWHDRIDSIARTAIDADTTAGMFRPLGGITDGPAF